MPLSPEDKASRKRDRMIETVIKRGRGKYVSAILAPLFQEMIRAEAAAKPEGWYPTVVDGKLATVFRRVGQCVCVTCGKVLPWKGSGVLEAGHFIPGRGMSILFEENGVHPQCNYCNQQLSGNQANYRLWMQLAYGQEEVDRLRRLKQTTRIFTREELVDMRIEFQERLNAAEEKMKGRVDAVLGLQG